MAPKPINSLKKGLAKFSKQIKACKDELNAKVLRRETISPAEEEWLDHEANTVDEQPHPTRRDVLKAASTITRYTEDMNEPIVCKMEALLGAFNRQLRLDETRGMKDTHLTEFFQRG